MLFHFKQNPDGTYTYQGVQRKPGRVTNPVARAAIHLAITLVFGFIYFYIKLPALNLQSTELYGFLILLVIVFIALHVFSGTVPRREEDGIVGHIRRHARIPLYILLGLVAVLLLGNVISWVAFHARSYAALLPIETGDFSEEVAEISFDQIPMLDSRSADTLADRKLGELADLVSQFTVSDTSVQINYKDRPVRVTYLDYGDIIKWWNNRSSGIPAYMVIDMVTQEVSVVRLAEGMRYAPSEYFSRDITRYLRFHYPTAIFDNIHFEIDEDGTPYWIATVVKKTIGLFGGTDVAGIVMVNAVTGEHGYYNLAEIPAWVDRACPAELIIEQYDYYGRYHNGFMNSLFGQRDCTETTDGYNYIALSDDVWLYTGITSVSADRGNIGFILVNQRTKTARYYSCAGAEEYSAMSSAQGAVQQYSYVATFPLLLNISGQPTYFMALKDASSLVKMYALVNVQQYQIVATGYTVAECMGNYEEMLLSRDIITEDEVHFEPAPDPDAEPEVSYATSRGVIGDLRFAVIEGNTCAYIRFVGSESWYFVSAADDPMVILLDAGQTITVRYALADADKTLIDAAVLYEVYYD